MTDSDITLSSGFPGLALGMIVYLSDGKPYRITDVISTTRYKLRHVPWWVRLWWWFQHPPWAPELHG
jgi:hypothetical protein